MIFDQHDLVPELYLSRFDRGKDLLYRAVVALERLTYRLADVVIATNESYRRGGARPRPQGPERVFVVRSAPDLGPLRGRRRRDPALKRGKQHLLCYLGVMGPQDGVDYALRVARRAARRSGRDDWHAVFVGSGDCFDEMVALSTPSSGWTTRSTFTGRIPDETLLRYLVDRRRRACRRTRTTRSTTSRR